MPAPEDLAVGILHSHHGIAGVQGFGHADDDEVLGIGSGGDDAIGRYLGGVVPAFPQNDGLFGLAHIGQGVVALHSLELIGAGFGDDVAVGITIGIEVLDVVAERIVVLLHAGGDVTEVYHGAAGHLNGFRVLVDLGVFAILLELDGKALDGSTVREVNHDVGALHGLLNLEYRAALVLGIDLLLIGEFHLQEFIAESLLSGGGQQIAVVLTVHVHGQDAGDALELEVVPAVAGSHQFGVGGGELAVEEAVLEVVHGRCRIGGIQGADAVLALIGIQTFHRLGGRETIGRDIAGREGHDNLVLGIFAVHHNLVAGFPGGLEDLGRLFALPQIHGGEDEGERTGFGLHLGIYRGGLVVLLTAGSSQGQDAKDRNFIDCLHNLFHLKVLCYSQFIGATYSYHSHTALSASSTPMYMFTLEPHFTVYRTDSLVSKLPATLPFTR